MKSRREHRVYLSRQAVALIAEMRELTGWCEFVFLSNLAPMSEGTLGAALRRLAYESDAQPGLTAAHREGCSLA